MKWDNEKLKNKRRYKKIMNKESRVKFIKAVRQVIRRII